MPSQEPVRDRDPDAPFISYCPGCGRKEPFSDDDLSRYGREGWPECCGRQVMCHAPGAAPRPGYATR